MKNLLEIQYNLVKASREVLFSYTSQIAEKYFLAENSNFGRGSIRNLLVHIGNTYEFWLGQQALQRNINIIPYAAIKNIAEAQAYFQNIDALVSQYLEAFAPDYKTALPVRINNQLVMASPVKLFTHVVTHEFHHKGQILSLSRHLGYIPIDTDIMR